MYYVKQLQDDDCGFACLKVLLADHFKKKEYLYIPNEKSKGNYSYKELMNIAKSYGLILQGIKVKEKEEILKNEHFPLIVTLKQNDTAHAVILEKFHKGDAVIFDPASGKMKISVDEFFLKWDLTALICIEECEAERYPNQFRLIEQKEKIISHILQLISSLFCIVGVYFLDSNHKILPIVLLTLFIVFEIFSRLYTIKLMKDMDNSFLELIDDNNYGNESIIIHYERYKKSELTTGLNVTFSLLTVFFIIFILVINSTFNLIFIGSTLILSLIKVMFIDRKIERDNLSAEKEEKLITKSKNIEEFKLMFSNLHKHSYKVGITTLLYRYIVVGMIILSVFLTMRFSSLTSATYLVFYTTLMFYFYEQLNSVFSIYQLSEQYDIDKCKIITSLRTNYQKDR